MSLQTMSSNDATFECGMGAQSYNGMVWMESRQPLPTPPTVELDGFNISFEYDEEGKKGYKPDWKYMPAIT